MAKIAAKKRARVFRKKGMGIKEIAKILSVSPASVHRWCQDIDLNPAQRRRLDEKSFRALQRGRKIAAKNQRKKRADEIKKLRIEGIKKIGNLSHREILVVGAALYWAEGFKKDSRLGFANSDPKMIKFFLRWLIGVCNVSPADIRLRVGINISHRERVGEIEEYWSNLTNIPISQFQKPFFQKFKWKKEFKEPRDYFGVLRVRANKQRKLFREIFGYIEGLKLNSAGLPAEALAEAG